MFKTRRIHAETVLGTLINIKWMTMGAFTRTKIFLMSQYLLMSLYFFPLSDIKRSALKKTCRHKNNN